MLLHYTMDPVTIMAGVPSFVCGFLGPVLVRTLNLEIGNVGVASDTVLMEMGVVTDPNTITWGGTTYINNPWPDTFFGGGFSFLSGGDNQAFSSDMESLYIPPNAGKIMGPKRFYVKYNECVAIRLSSDANIDVIVTGLAEITQ